MNSFKKLAAASAITMAFTGGAIAQSAPAQSAPGGACTDVKTNGDLLSCLTDHFKMVDLLTPHMGMLQEMTIDDEKIASIPACATSNVLFDFFLSTDGFSEGKLDRAVDQDMLDKARTLTTETANCMDSLAGMTDEMAAHSTDLDADGVATVTKILREGAAASRQSNQALTPKP